MDGSEPIRKLKEDPKLATLVDRHGELHLNPADDPFERLTVSIINQQLSTRSAEAIKGRVFESFDVTPESLLRADEKELRETGLSRQKIDYIQGIAEAFLEGEIDMQSLEKMSNSEVIDELTSIHGIGDWTAKMFLMFVLGREDVFPVEDLGIRKGMRDVYREDMTRDEMVEKAEDWRPYRSIASLYLWRTYD